MSLIVPQKVKIKWSSNKQHYINLGYCFTNIGDEFEVDVNDLTKGSSVAIDVKCDYCGCVVKMEWKQYLSLKGETYCCKDCLKHKKKTRDKDGKLIFVEIPYRNREWLYNEYIVKNRGARDIANECGINLRTLREWISIFNLPNKKNKDKRINKRNFV